MALTKDQERKLDKMAWHSLTGPHAEFAQGDGPALRYDRSMAVFCAVESLGESGWQALGELVGPGRAVVLFQTDPGPIPDDYDEIFRYPVLQMIADGEVRPLPRDPAEPTPEIVELGADDVEEMLALTALTEPGPFFPQTHRLGAYVGVREEGRLIAMAGERLHADGVSEISAVCTHPDARRRGLGGLLTMAMVDVIRGRGELAMLHVATTNDPAIPLYGQLGFRIRCEVETVAARASQ